MVDMTATAAAGGSTLTDLERFKPRDGTTISKAFAAIYRDVGSRWMRSGCAKGAPSGPSRRRSGRAAPHASGGKRAQWLGHILFYCIVFCTMRMSNTSR
jgi:hypothetical protein